MVWKVSRKAETFLRHWFHMGLHKLLAHKQNGVLSHNYISRWENAPPLTSYAVLWVRKGFK